MNNNGELVTRDGFNLLDKNTGAPIVIPPNHTNIDIINNGTVYINNAPIGQIDVVHFEELDYLQKVGRNLYTAVNTLPVEPQNATVTQGFVESSNVDPIMEMVRMIDAVRGFELYQKVVHTYDSLNEQAANVIAKM
jgi:flagellar basal-body rod protein FlgG